METALTPDMPGLAGLAADVAGLLELAAGTSLEGAAAAVYRRLLDAADDARRRMTAGGQTAEETAVAAALLYSGVMQGRTAVASWEVTAEMLAAARRRGQAERCEQDYQAGVAAGTRQERARAARRRAPGTGTRLRDVSSRPA